MNYPNAKKHSAPKTDVAFKFKLCYQEFPGFDALLQQKITQHGFPNKKANVDPGDIFNEVADMNLKEEVRSCQHFIVDSELEQVRHKVFY